jgi:hypothetical protein
MPLASIADKRAGHCLIEHDRSENRYPLSRIMLSHVIDTAGLFGTSLRCGGSKQSAQEARRCSKKRGGGIAPAAIGALIEAGFCSVNALGRPPGPKVRS